MRNMRTPKLSEVPVPVVPIEDMRKLLKVCSGKSFEDAATVPPRLCYRLSVALRGCG
jgi:hypothetical protein